ncbi:MAG: hypothetical protein ACR2PW_07040 [Gammaproteobacteria bacterium]
MPYQQQLVSLPVAQMTKRNWANHSGHKSPWCLWVLILVLGASGVSQAIAQVAHSQSFEGAQQTPLPDQQLPYIGSDLRVRFLLQMEVQSGGDGLVSAPVGSNQGTRDCVQSYYVFFQYRSCNTSSGGKLYAGDGLGLKVGVQVPISDLLAFELMLGGLFSGLSSEDAEIASISRFTSQAMLMIQPDSVAHRFGVGLIHHSDGLLSIAAETQDRAIASSLGGRFQMDWQLEQAWDGPSYRLGFYFDQMQYDIEGYSNPVGANAIGFVSTIAF